MLHPATPAVKAPRKSSVQPIQNATYADGQPLMIDGVFVNVERAQGALLKLGLETNSTPAVEAARSKKLPIFAKADPALLPSRIEGMRELAAQMWARQQAGQK